MSFASKALLFSLVCRFVGLARAEAELPACGDPTIAEALDLVGDGVLLETVRPGDDSESCSVHSDRYLAPKSIHWHIFEVEDGDALKIFMSPEGVVTPEVSGVTLGFKIGKDVPNWARDDQVQAGVQLYLPSSHLKRVIVDGVDAIVEVISISSTNTTTDGQEEDSTDRLEVIDSGVDNKVYVSSPSTVIHYRGTGVDSEAYIEGGSGSSIEVTGVDNRVHMATPQVSKIRLTGVDQRVTLQGNYDEVEMTGVSGTLLVNGNEGCDGLIKNSGVSNKCRTTADIVDVPVLECYANTTISRKACHWDLSTGAAVGIGIGILVLIVVISVACCYCCFRCCGCSRRTKSRGQEYPLGTQPVRPSEAQGLPIVSSKISTPPPIVKAKVVEAVDISEKTTDTQKELYPAQLT